MRAPLGIRRGLTDYGDPAFSLFIRGAYARGSGLTAEDLARPVIGLAQTWSEFNPCHRHLREVAEAVKRGVWQAGGALVGGGTVQAPAGAVTGQIMRRESPGDRRPPSLGV